MATTAEIQAAIAKAEAKGRKDLADQLRARLSEASDAPASVPDVGRIEAAIAKAEAAGRKDLADKLRAKMPAPEAPVATGPITSARADEEAPAARDARLVAMFEAANPALAGRYRTAAELPRVGESVMGGAGGGGHSGAPRVTVQPWQNVKADTFGDTAAALMEGPIAGMKAFGGGLTGGPSPSYDYLRESGVPRPVAGPLSKVGDAGGAVLSALGAGVSGVIGLGAEMVPGQGKQAEQKLGEDLAGMSMFVVPELAGASSIPARVAATAPKAAPVAKVTGATNVAAKTPEEIGALANKAASGGMGSVRAQEALAAEAKINPEAKAAADRLGIDLPADVFADDEMVRATAGLTRSEVGREPEALWRRAVKNARDKADEIMAQMDGSPDIASVSEAVKGALQATQASLKSTAKALYETVDAAVPKGTQAEVSNIVKALNEVIGELGGVKGMSAQEKALFDLVTNSDQAVTYGRLLREKNLIGKAIARGDSPYSSLDSATLNRLYAAISEDQLATVASIGDDALRAKLREANQLTAKQKALEKRIVAAFGSDLDGSIGAKLKAAVTTAAKGDIAGLTRILKVIPEELRQSATVSAISAATRSARATEPGFGLAEFGKVFGGIIENKPVFNLIGKTIGPEAMGALKDLHTVARRITMADSNVLRTGKANQALVGALQAESAIGKVLQSTAGQRVVQSAAIGGATVMSGPFGGMIAGPIATALMSAKPDMLAKVGKLFASDEFQSLMIEAAKGQVKAETIAKLNTSKAFRDWSKGSGVSRAQQLLEGGAVPAGEAAAQAAQPEYETLWQRYGR